MSKPVGEMGIHELREFITGRGGSTQGCIEKSDLQERAQTMQQELLRLFCVSDIHVEHESNMCVPPFYMRYRGI